MDRQDTINFRRWRRRTESVEGVKRYVSKSGCCATPLVSEAFLSTSPRVRPSGITRGYAWCVPSGDSECGLGGFSFLSLSTSPLLHGFTLRVSPAVTHGVSPPGTVGAGWEVSLFSLSPLLHFSTGSPFGHHPRLRMVCPLRGQWVRVGRFLFFLPLHFSTSPHLHGFALWASPAVTHGVSPPGTVDGQ